MSSNEAHAEQSRSLLSIFVLEGSSMCGCTYVYSEKRKIATAARALEKDIQGKLVSGSMLLKEGSYVPLSPWKIPPSLTKVKVASTSILLEAQETAQLVQGLLQDWEESAVAATKIVAETQALELLPMADSDTQGDGMEDKRLAARSWSVSLMRRGNCLALRELFQTEKGELAVAHAAARNLEATLL